MRDTELKEQISEVYQANFRITGAVRGKRVVTTVADASTARAPDLVERDFVASAPNRCWVADFTHVAAFAGVVYVAFVRPWCTLSQVELATAERVDWYNHRRLHGGIGHVPPVEYETAYYLTATKPQVTTTT